MKRLVFLITFLSSRLLVFSSACLLAFSQGYFGEAQWIGAITKAEANIPEGRLCSGNVIKQTKEAWDKANPLSRRSIILRR